VHRDLKPEVSKLIYFICRLWMYAITLVFQRVPSLTSKAGL
jgi:hypothetical protein